MPKNNNSEKQNVYGLSISFTSDLKNQSSGQHRTDLEDVVLDVPEADGDNTADYKTNGHSAQVQHNGLPSSNNTKEDNTNNTNDPDNEEEGGKGCCGIQRKKQPAVGTFEMVSRVFTVTNSHIVNYCSQ